MPWLIYTVTILYTGMLIILITNSVASNSLNIQLNRAWIGNVVDIYLFKAVRSLTPSSGW